MRREATSSGQPSAPAACVVEWGVKRTLLDYMERDAAFAWAAEGGGTFSLGAGARIPAIVAPDGAVRASGAVTISAHHGALTVPLVGLEIRDGALSIADPAGGPGDRIVLVDVRRVGEEAPTDVEIIRRYATSLSRSADRLFMFNYLPGVAFDDLIVRIPLAPLEDA